MFSVPYQRLARFCGNLATCLEAGVGIEQSLKNAKRSLAHTRLYGAGELALVRVRQGDSLSDALAAAGARWPPFVLPMIEAGEQTGRLDAALRYLEHHCLLLEKPARALQRAWMYPLAILLAGTAIRLAVCLVLAPLSTTAAVLFEAVKGYGMLGVAALIVFASPLKPVVDRLKLQLPLWGGVERELGVNRFFHVLAMLYATGGRRVESMVRFATRSIGNGALRVDFQRVAERIEQGDTLPRAFQTLGWLSRDEQDQIAAGDLAGKLEQSFERISEQAGESLRFKTELFTQISVRVTMVVATLAVVATLRGVLVTALLRQAG